MAITTSVLLDAIKDDVVVFEGDRNILISRPAPLNSATLGDVAFCSSSSEASVDLVRRSACVVFLVDEMFPRSSIPRPVNFVVTGNPRLTFLRLVSRCFGPKSPTPGIHSTASIHPEALIEKSVSVGPFTYVGKSRIGANSILHGGVYVYDGVRIGSNVVVHGGTVIGADGFGYERNERGEMEKFVHIGGVEIGDNVEIGANTCVDRGTLANTIIRRGAKIDNLVHIAHNTDIGEDAVVIANAMVGGGTKIGSRAWIAPSATLREQIVIGEDATVGLASCVTRSVQPRTTVAGAPARPLNEFLQILKYLRSLSSKNKKIENPGRQQVKG